jgi:hypothetical protein
MTITGISEKEVAIQEDLKSKLDNIAGDAPKKRNTKKSVSQEVVSPRDAEVDANVGELDKMKQMIEKNEVPEPAVVPQTVTIEYPDATKHKYISFVKSGFRILAGVTLCFGEFAIAGVLLIVAEILGIAEEMV